MRLLVQRTYSENIPAVSGDINGPGIGDNGLAGNYGRVQVAVGFEANIADFGSKAHIGAEARVPARQRSG
jgi:hypothetical protein